MELAQGRVQWQALVLTVLNIWFLSWLIGWLLGWLVS